MAKQRKTDKDENLTAQERLDRDNAIIIDLTGGGVDEQTEQKKPDPPSTEGIGPDGLSNDIIPA